MYVRFTHAVIINSRLIYLADAHEIFLCVDSAYQSARMMAVCGMWQENCPSPRTPSFARVTLRSHVAIIEGFFVEHSRETENFMKIRNM